MGEITKNENNFVGYEYKDVTISREMMSMYADSYGNFGWELVDTSVPFAGLRTVTMKFKRNRQIRSKAELTRLQRQFDSFSREILSLERSKSKTAAAVAYIIGFIGTAFMAGSVFAITSETPNIFLCVILAIPAIMGWMLPYFLFSNIRRKKTERLSPLIESKYDEIYGVCEKANSLL